MEKDNIMTNRILSILVPFVMVLSISGCDKISEFNQPGAKKVLNNYLNASLKNQSEKAYDYISSEDKSIKSLSEYKSETEKQDNLFATVIVSNVSFKVLKINESGKTANADVEITLPDIGILFKDLMGATFSSVFGDKDKDEIEKAIAKKYDTGEVPTTTKNIEFHLLKEKDGWKVFLDWKSKKAAKEDKISALLSDAKQLRKSKKLSDAIQKYEEVLALNEEMVEAKEAIKEITQEIQVIRENEEKIIALLSDAKQLRELKKLSGAIQKYEEVLALNGEMIEAKEAIKETTKEIQDIKEKQKYLSKVTLYDLQAKYYETYLDKKVPGVVFKIKNTGNRTLKKVQITVYFKDTKGTIIYEKEYHPVLETEYSFSGDNKPLKPNYIWQMERGKFYKTASVPTEWKEGSVSAKVTNIEFSE
jgi:3-methyladenine DNA glycosylase Tag